MASLKKLAGQTMWYGVSNIAARLLTYLLTPYLAYTLTSYEGQVVFGQQSYIYALFPIMNVLYTYGMETSYFRFCKTEDKLKLYRTQLTMILASTAFFSLLLLLFREQVAAFAELGENLTYVGWCAGIIALDTLSALPYARLRQENRPRKYAFTKIAGIIVFVCTIVFLFSFGDDIAYGNPGSYFAQWYERHWGIGFILFANLLQAIVTLALLFAELKDYRPQLDPALTKRLLRYGLPILLTGFAGWMNEGLNRVMFKNLYPASDTENLRLLGFYTAALRLAIVINLFIQAFRMAAEPFFFSVSSERNAPETYARVMKWLVILLSLMFLNVVLFIDIWKYYVPEEYRQAIELVPILLLSFMFVGIYYNLSIWYKLTDKTEYGTYIILTGSVFTVLFNWIFIPVWGYHACAWGTLWCNAILMALSYYWGQRYYPIPYPLRRLGLYFGVMLLVSALFWAVSRLTASTWLHLLAGTALFLVYLSVIWWLERQELQTLRLMRRRQ